MGGARVDGCLEERVRLRERNVCDDFVEDLRWHDCAGEPCFGFVMHRGEGTVNRHMR